MYEVRIELDAPHQWIRELSNGSTVRILDIKKDFSKTVDLIELSSEKNEIDKIKLRNLEYSERIDSGRVIALLNSTECPVCSSVASVNCFVTEATTLQNGRMEWRILAPSDGELRKLYRLLDRNNVSYTVKYVSKKIERKKLTARQEYILRVAYSYGYFNFPRNAKLSEIAKKVGVTQGTLSELLRRAIKNLVEHHINSC